MPLDMQALARLGAQVRIAELIAEIDTLLAAFPDIGSRPARAAQTAARPAATRRQASEETRAKMRAAWARRKAASAGDADAAAPASPGDAPVTARARKTR